MVKIRRIFEKIKSEIMRMLSANVINKIAGFVSTMIITRLLTQDEYGLISYTLTVYAYLQLVTGLGLVAGALQFGTENHGNRKEFDYYKYCSSIGLFVDIGLVIVSSIIVILYPLPIQEAKKYILALFPFLIIEFFLSLGQSILRSQNRINEYARVLNLNTIVTMVGTCVGAVFGVFGVLAGRYLAGLVSLFFEVYLLRKSMKVIICADPLMPEEKKQLWHYSLFVGASAALNGVIYALDITLIAELVRDTTLIGIYRVGTLIPNALQIVPSSVVVALLPTFIYHRKDITWLKTNLRKDYYYLALCNAIICAIIIVFSPLVIRIISGEKYLPSVPVLRILTFGYFFSGTFRVFSTNILVAFRRVYYSFFISISSCISDVLLNVYFIKRNGMIGAAYATFFVDIIMAVISFGYVFYLVKREKINEVG